MENPNWELRDIPGDFRGRKFRLPVTIQDGSVTLKYERPNQSTTCTFEGANDKEYFSVLQDTQGNTTILIPNHECA